MTARSSPARRPTLARRLLAWYAVAVIVLLAGLAIVVNERVGSLLVDELTESLAEEAEVVKFALARSDALQEDTAELGGQIGTRITVIDTDGVVRADSVSTPAEMENHADRPEVIEALAGRLGVDSRLSETVGVSFRYVALPYEGDFVYRLSVPLTDVNESLNRLRFSIVGSALPVVLIGVALVWLVASRISRPLGEITASVERIASGDRAARLPDPNLAESARLAQSVEKMTRELQQRITDAEEARGLRDQVLSALEEAVVLVSADGTVAYSNEPAREMFGDPENVNRIGPTEARRALEAALSTQSVHRSEFTSGVPPRQLAVAAIPIRQGRMVVLATRDITESKRVEAMRRDFVADASHELKTPVAAIRAGAETILRALDDDPAAVARFAEQIDKNAVRLGQLVADLLDLSRLEAGTLDMTPTHLSELVVGEVEAFRTAAAGKDLQVSMQVAEVEATVNEDDLRLAVRNLLHNALQYTSAGDSVDVSLEGADGEAVIEVADSGMGIPSRDLSRVFERFYRVDIARSRETGGTGLGLAIVRHVVQRHGGVVEVESELGRGSTFRIRLPLTNS
ncbi:MAG: HAMP domain-containing protein [Acidimicrobiia bacterium]|nr:HAMP domain-containing protein [Acidimicrobiia bacterium]